MYSLRPAVVNVQRTYSVFYKYASSHCMQLNALPHFAGSVIGTAFNPPVLNLRWGCKGGFYGGLRQNREHHEGEFGVRSCRFSPPGGTKLAGRGTCLIVCREQALRDKPAAEPAAAPQGCSPYSSKLKRRASERDGTRRASRPLDFCRTG
jgi:hypothetical protein